MSTREAPPLSRRAAGALLDGQTPPDAGHRRLAEMLTALGTEPLASVTPGERTARVAFRARQELGPAPRSWLRARRVAVRSCVATAAGMAVAVTVLAFTAGAGDLPSPLQNAVHYAFGVAAPRSHHRPPAPQADDHATATGHSRQTTHATASPSPDLTALCRTYLAETPVAAAQPQHHHDGHHSRGDAGSRPNASPATPTASAPDPAWLVTLATAAGGKADVSTFCQQRLAPSSVAPAGSGSDGQSVAPTGIPGQNPAPAGAPSGGAY